MTETETIIETGINTEDDPSTEAVEFYVMENSESNISNESNVDTKLETSATHDEITNAETIPSSELGDGDISNAEEFDHEYSISDATLFLSEKGLDIKNSNGSIVGENVQAMENAGQHMGSYYSAVAKAAATGRAVWITNSSEGDKIFASVILCDSERNITWHGYSKTIERSEEKEEDKELSEQEIEQTNSTAELEQDLPENITDNSESEKVPFSFEFLFRANEIAKQDDEETQITPSIVAETHSPNQIENLDEPILVSMQTSDVLNVTSSQPVSKESHETIQPNVFQAALEMITGSTIDNMENFPAEEHVIDENATQGEEKQTLFHDNPDVNIEIGTSTFFTENPVEQIGLQIGATEGSPTIEVASTEAIHIISPENQLLQDEFYSHLQEKSEANKEVFESAHIISSVEGQELLSEVIADEYRELPQITLENQKTTPENQSVQVQDAKIQDAKIIGHKDNKPVEKPEANLIPFMTIEDLDQLPNPIELHDKTSHTEAIQIDSDYKTEIRIEAAGKNIVESETPFVETIVAHKSPDFGPQPETEVRVAQEQFENSQQTTDTINNEPASIFVEFNSHTLAETGIGIMEADTDYPERASLLYEGRPGKTDEIVDTLKAEPSDTSNMAELLSFPSGKRVLRPSLNKPASAQVRQPKSRQNALTAAA